MTDDTADPIEMPETEKQEASPPKVLTPEARRALAEADARRAAHEAQTQSRELAKEFNGPKGPEPTRYGDWETKGIISDF